MYTSRSEPFSRAEFGVGPPEQAQESGHYAGWDRFQAVTLAPLHTSASPRAASTSSARIPQLRDDLGVLQRALSETS